MSARGSGEGRNDDREVLDVLGPGVDGASAVRGPSVLGGMCSSPLWEVLRAGPALCEARVGDRFLERLERLRSCCDWPLSVVNSWMASLAMPIVSILGKVS